MSLLIQRIFENKDLLVVDKPGGVLTTPGRAGVKDPRQVLGLQLQEELQIQIFPIHRLDFEVSGLVLFAKNAMAHKIANQWFEKRLVHKTYEALTLQEQNFSHLPAELNIARHSFVAKVNEKVSWKCLLLRGKKRAYENPKGDLSLTQAELLGACEVSGYHQPLWRWHLSPITGRSHQLRYEMSRHGFPILGDTLYGSRLQWKKESIALRAIKLDLSEMTDSERLGLPEFLQIEGLTL